MSILTPLNQCTDNDQEQPNSEKEAKPLENQTDFTAEASNAIRQSDAMQLNQRPSRSVSPVKTFKLLRDIEKLHTRSEQHFMEVVEKEMSSSEDSSPMYKRFR